MSLNTVPDKTSKPDISDFLTHPAELVEELKRRRTDSSIKKQIENFLAGDIPSYLREEPVLYFASHIVTPNFETIRFSSLMRDLGLKTVLTGDSRGLFVSQNHTKKALCKLPILTRLTQKDGKLNEQYQNLTVVDFEKVEGKRFCEIQTLWGEELIHFHTRLFRELGLSTERSIDDADWIDRHGRGNLLEHYKHLLMLFVTHGVFFENYDLDDSHELQFVQEILQPASDFVKAQTGYVPLIAPIAPTSLSAPESPSFWLSYPKQVIDIVRGSLSRRDVV